MKNVNNNLHTELSIIIMLSATDAMNQSYNINIDAQPVVVVKSLSAT